MNAKTTQRYNLIIALAAMQGNDPQVPATLAELCANDFQTAFEMWEYMLGKCQQNLDNTEVCENLESKPFTLFLRMSETKTRSLLCESSPLIKSIYGSCATSCTGNNFNFLVNLILSNKIDVADEILMRIKSNSTIDFNENMRIIIEGVFNTYCTKNNVKVPVLNNKQKKLLFSYVEKVRGPNKSLLTQRLKEL